MQGKVEICGVNTARLTVLPQVEMDMLLRRAKEGDTAAREKLIEGNLRLVLSVIQRFDKRGESPDDLFQVGCIGLIKAISNFDPDKNVRFSTYGVPMIAGEIRRYLRDNSAIRVSRSIRDVAYRVLQCKEAMLLQLGREPTIEELANQLEIPAEDVSEALDAVCAPVSLYDPVYSDGGGNPPSGGSTIVIPEEPVPLVPAPELEIPEEPVPLAPAPELEIPDEEVPLANVPKTGDASALWLVLSALSGTGLLLSRKKREDEE